MTRAMGVTVVAVVAAVGLSVVTAVAVVGNDDPPMPTPAASDEVAEQDPAALVGAWWGEGDPIVDDALVVLRPSGELSIYLSNPCELMGSWSASESGLASMSVDSWSGNCTDMGESAYALTTRIARFESGADDIGFRDSEGEVSLALTPATDSSDWSSAVDVRDVTAALDEKYVAQGGIPSLPDGLVPPSAEQLVEGRWLPVDTASSDYWPDKDRPHATFLPEGIWQGSDGCNGQGGNYSFDPDSGEWLASSGAQTLIGCRNVDVAGMIAPARMVALDGDELMFFDAKGAEIGRFVQE